MQLSLAMMPAWVRWQQPAGDKASWAEAETLLRRQAGQDPNCLAQRLIALNADGEIQASLLLSVFQPGVLTFAAPRCQPNVSAEVLLGLIKAALAYCHSLNARLQCRLPETPQLTPVLTALPGLGASLSHCRIEFWAPLTDLPDETGSPLVWDKLEPAGSYSLQRAAKLMQAASLGDPDWDAEDDALILLQSYLAEDGLICAPACVQIAHTEGQPAGIVIAQVNPQNGWSRITYMGILPAFRGQGLGKWLHRHGFAMLRSQGGRSYHGGTVQGNKPMEALFRSQGCQLEKVLQEWHWDAPSAAFGN